MRLDLTCKKCGSSLEYERVGNTDYYACYSCNTSAYEKPETLEVRIISCNNPHSWYADKVGDIFEVKAPKDDSTAYYVLDDDPEYVRLIQRDNAVEVGKNAVEDMVISLSREVAKLKTSIRTLQESVRRFAETATEADYQAGKALELIKLEKGCDCKCKSHTE